MPRVTVEQKLQLRRWFKSQPSKPSQAEAIVWFKQKFNETLPQYQISRILHSSTLDSLNVNSPGLHHTRVSSAQWPVLEEILQRWQMGMAVRAINTSRDVLMERARYIWISYPEARNSLPPDNPPVFGSRWCRLFQKRFPVSNHVMYGVRSSTEGVISLPEMKAQMMRIKRVIAEIPRGNCYNMSQTGLFWHRSPSAGLATASQAGGSLDETRISVAVTTNDTGDDKPDLWVVGKAACPRALENFNWKAHKIVWRHNRKAWITAVIMNEWLQAFYEYIQANKPGQKVLLLLEPFKSYLAAVKDTPPPPNITIEFFPASVASMYQPNGRGIANALKIYFRRSFLLWMSKQASAEAGLRDRVSQMNLRLAMMWLSNHWFVTLKPDAIIKSWQKSKLLVAAPGKEAQNLPTDLPGLYEQATAGLSSKLAISEFLNPSNEDLPPHEPLNDLDVLEEVLEEWSLQPDYRDIEEINEEAMQPERVPVTLEQGLAGLVNVTSLVESHDAFTSLELQSLQRLRQSIMRSLQGSARQSSVGAVE